MLRLLTWLSNLAGRGAGDQPHQGRDQLWLGPSSWGLAQVGQNLDRDKSRQYVFPELEFLASGWTSTSLPQSPTRGVASSPTSGGWANQVLLMSGGPGPIKSCWFLRPCSFLMMVVASSKNSNYYSKSIHPWEKRDLAFNDTCFQGAPQRWPDPQESLWKHHHTHFQVTNSSKLHFKGNPKELTGGLLALDSHNAMLNHA